MNKQLVKQIAIMLLSANSFVVIASPYYNNIQTPMSAGIQNQIQAKSPYSNNNRMGMPYSRQSQIISVMAAPTGSSVVLGGTVVPLREVTLSA